MTLSEISPNNATILPKVLLTNAYKQLISFFGKEIGKIYEGEI
jgi:hypothetical protein